ncbi:zinc finger protein 260-like [Cyclopterus lumpus]|uniref:zinc finger protein 260-like n=1 Tax=Cyclopterus lumpus TaxID=8103 RepID=UPI00148617D7|nr:zinc finger protein 260-like [Cyclopterus lumpus]
MLRTAKMELLRALVSQRLSAAAEEIFRIVEGTIVEYENKMSCSTWVVDSHRRLLDVTKSHSEDVTSECSKQQQPAASVDVSVCWEEPTEDCPDINDSSPASEKDLEIRVDFKDDDVKQECDLDTLLKIPEGKKPFECPVCLSGFSSKKTMVQHIKKHPEDNSSLYRCQYCDRCFRRKSEFILHTRTHKGAKPYKYRDCEISFDERDNLLIHRQKHAVAEAEILLRSDCRQEEETLPLTITPFDNSEFHQESLQPLCLYQIQTVADIDKDSSAAVPVDHIKTEPAGADGGVSDGTTVDQLLLSVHPSEQGERETEPNRLNVKNILPRRPSGKPTIVQFEAGTAQKPFKCPCCAKCFSLTKTLTRHVRIHTGDNPYQCQFCGKNFCQKSDLVNHTRIHTGERPYQCQECRKSFMQKGHMVVHMRKHKRQKPYQCQECSCSFTKRSYFDCHMQSHRV